ncbi:MAG: glycoside hydrolase family 2 protein, partial [Planctomycetota bacterium]
MPLESLTVLCDGAWQLRRTDQSDPPVPAVVPGCVHTDLQAAGILEDLWYRDNEKDFHWVFQADWTYTRMLEIPDGLLERRRVELVCHGLDTLATVYLNDVELGRCDNMFRTWRFDVQEHLRPGANELRVEFASPLATMQAGDAQRHRAGWNIYHPDFFGRSYVRKMGCAFGWDWGPMAPTVGIWRSMELVASDAAIDDIRIRQDHGDKQVNLNAQVAVDGPAHSVRATLRYVGQVVVSQVATAAATVELDLPVDRPRLWQPNGQGDQPLYDLQVELLDGAGNVLDSQARRIGLRTIELVRRKDQYGESFRFAVNGREIFAKGANWIPCSVFPSSIEDATYRHLVASMADSGMNMVRVWGGGIYEDERFYDFCDEMGILVWQDFLFSCGTYPTDEAFLANVRAEAVDNVRRLRHRACLALWCGNNEIEQGMARSGWSENGMAWGEYEKLFDKLLPDVVAEHDGREPHRPRGRDLRRRPRLVGLVRGPALRGPARLELPLHERVRLPELPRAAHRRELHRTPRPPPDQLGDGLPPAIRPGQPDDLQVPAGLVLPAEGLRFLPVADPADTGPLRPVRRRPRQTHPGTHGRAALLAAQRSLAGGNVVLDRRLRPLEGVAVFRQAVLQPRPRQPAGIARRFYRQAVRLEPPAPG